MSITHQGQPSGERQLTRLAAVVRGEYRDWPALRLTPAQVRRLFRLDAATCDALLQQLVDGGELRLTPDGAYVVRN